jgi:hypothetical protein
MNDQEWAAIVARDEAAGDGISVADPLVFADRHDLVVEVSRLRGIIERLRSGRPLSN